MTSFLEPTSVEDACRLLTEDVSNPKLISGGTALVLMMRHGLIAPTSLISLGSVPGLASIEHLGQDLRIGARATLGQVAAAVAVRRGAPALARACSRVGNVRVRNVATIGGNVAEADYASDPPTALIAMNASCTVQGVSGKRTIMVQDLITGFYSTALAADEVIVELRVPVGDPGQRSSYLKYVSRSSEDRPCVGVAAVADFTGDALSRLTVVVGAVAEVPQRRDEITATAIGRPLSPSLRQGIADAYSESIDPMDDARGSAWYRRRMIRVFVRRALESVAQS